VGQYGGTARRLERRERRQPSAEPGSAGRERKAARSVRIVYDVSPLSHPLTGVGNYVRGSLAGLVEAAAGEHEIVAFAPTSPAGARTIPEALDGIPVELRTKTLPFAHAWRTAWSSLGRPAAERLLGPFDVLHFQQWMTPPQRSGIRSTMVHDLVPLRFPEWTTWRTRSMHRAQYEAAKRCDVVFVNSAYTLRDAVERLALDERRIHVAHPGVDPVFTAEGEAARAEGDYVLAVATLEPRKNLRRAVDAAREAGVELRVVGARGWGDVDVEGWVGEVPDAALAALYRGARCVVYPSLYEGFGLPVLEAMACGSPVVTSSSTAMEEVAGGAAVLVDPLDTSAIAAGIEEAIARRDELVPLGAARAREFPWSRAADAVEALWRELA